MRFLWFLFLVLPAQADEMIRVKLWSEEAKMSSVDFSVEGSVHRLQGLGSAIQTVAFPQKQNLRIQYEEVRGQGRWVIDGFQSSALVIHENFLALEGPALILNHKKVPPKIILSAQKVSGKKSGKILVNVIGILPLEKYVMGVLAHEMPAQWPQETLRAQAVATRSYSLAVMKERSKKPYHLESTVMDQVFGYFSDEDLREKYPAVVSAVEATYGQYLESDKNRVLKAYYHSDCGGETASNEEAWTNSAELVSVTDESCPQNPQSRWSLKLSRAELFRRLKKWAPTGAEKITKLDVIGVPGRLRVAQVEMTWDQGAQKRIEASQFREALGFFDFKSTQFKILSANPDWIFEGRGFGHGVGLCQWGSRHLGKSGWEFKKILNHYYPTAHLKILNGTLVTLKDRTPL